MRQSRELAKAIEDKGAMLKVKGSIEMTQKIESNNAVYTMLFGNGITQGFNALHPSVSQTDRFEDYLGDEMSSGSVTEGSKFGYCFQGIANVS
jgi:hypothetical protein